MLDPSRHEPDRPPRLARAAAVCGTSRKLCPAERATQLLEVARFHLGNGARLERINWLGNTDLRAIQESFGIMVNYLYDHESIENNHEAFVRGSTIVPSPEVDALMQGSA
jgi:hypothetical protein